MFYADKDQLIADYLPEATKPAEKAAIGRILENASAFVDSYCKRPPGYFQPVSSEQTLKRVRGEGQRFLRLPVHLHGSITEIDGKAFSQYSGELYESEKNGWLYKDGGLSTDCVINAGGSRYFPPFVDGKIYKIKAVWGYTNLPKDLQEAVRLLTVSIYETAKGTLGQISVEGFALKPNLIPPDVLVILDRYKRREFEI